MSFDFTEIANEVAETQADVTKVQTGGGYTPPPKGLARLRFVGYMELGKVNKTYKGDKKVEDRAWLIFELHGKQYEPKELEDGTVIPHRITVRLNKSMHEKALYYRLFKRMNYEGKATSFIQLLGQGFLGNVGHFTFKDDDGNERVTANFRDDTGALTIRPPRIETLDEETGEAATKTVPVPPAISSQRCIIWDAKPEWLPQMWESIALPENEDGEGNLYQKLIQEAINFEGSAIQEWLASKGEDLGIPAAVDAKGGKKAPASKAKPKAMAEEPKEEAPWEGEDKDEDSILDELGL